MKSDFDKIVTRIKNIVGDKTLEIPDYIKNDMKSVQGFKVSVATIELNVREQNVIYEDKIVNDEFILNYINRQNNKNYIKKSLILTKNICNLNKFIALYLEIIEMIKQEYNNEKFTIPHLTDRRTQYEQIVYDKLFRYIKYNIMKYDETQTVEKSIIDKLQELQNGRIHGNKHHKATCNYSYDDILLAFKFCYFDIEKALRYKHFDSNSKKFNYVCAIVKDNINTVIDRRKAQTKAQEYTPSEEITSDTYSKGDYVRKTEDYSWVTEDMW